MTALSLKKKITEIYEKIVYWKRNIFMLPFGKAGKKYIDHVNYLLNEWLNDSPLAETSFKMIMVKSQLLLQKPSIKSKIKDYISALERRFDLWLEGEFTSLLEEGKTIQKDLKKSVKKHH